LTQAVNILKIKRFVAKAFPADSALRTVILSEPDQLPVAEFLTKIEIWMRLLSISVRSPRTFAERGHTATSL
jgi:hypothetical protein